MVDGVADSVSLRDYLTPFQLRRWFAGGEALLEFQKEYGVHGAG